MSASLLFGYSAIPTVTPANGMTPKPFMTEEDIALAVLELDTARYTPGQRLRAIGGPLNKMRQGPPPETTILKVNERAGGYEVERWKGSCIDPKAFGGNSFVTFAAAEIYWRPVIA